MKQRESFTFEIETDAKVALQELAVKTDVSLAHLLRRAVREFLVRVGGTTPADQREAYLDALDRHVS